MLEFPSKINRNITHVFCQNNAQKDLGDDEKWKNSTSYRLIQISL